MTDMAASQDLQEGGVFEITKKLGKKHAILETEAENDYKMKLHENFSGFLENNADAAAIRKRFLDFELRLATSYASGYLEGKTECQANIQAWLEIAMSENEQTSFKSLFREDLNGFITRSKTELDGGGLQGDNDEEFEGIDNRLEEIWLRSKNNLKSKIKRSISKFRGKIKDQWESYLATNIPNLLRYTGVSAELQSLPSSSSSKSATDANEVEENGKGEGLGSITLTPLEHILAIKTTLETRKNGANDRREIEKLDKALSSVQKAINFVSKGSEEEEEEEGEASTSTFRGRKPDEAFLAVLYLIISVAGGGMPLLAKFGMTRIPYIDDWLPGFKPLTERYGTTMKDVYIFRWVCSTPYAKIYENTLRQKLSVYLVPATMESNLDDSFIKAVKPYLLGQADFRNVMEMKGKMDAQAYALVRDKVTADGPRGFYANKHCTDDDRSELIYIYNRASKKYQIDDIMSIFNTVAFGEKAPEKPPRPGTLESKMAKSVLSPKKKKTKPSADPQRKAIEDQLREAKRSKEYRQHLHPLLKSFYVSTHKENVDTWTTYTPWSIPDSFSLGRYLIDDCRRDGGSRLLLFGDPYQLIGAGIIRSFEYFHGPSQDLRVVSMFHAKLETFRKLTDVKFSFSGLDDISPSSIFFHNYNEQSQKKLSHADVQLINCVSINFVKDLYSFKSTHFILCASCLGEISLLFLLLVIVDNEIPHLLVPHTIWTVLNSTVLVLPAMENLKCFHTCVPISSVCEEQLVISRSKHKIYYLSRDELQSHNPEFRFALYYHLKLVVVKEFCKGYGKVIVNNGKFSWAHKEIEELMELDENFGFAFTVEESAEAYGKDPKTTPWRPEFRYLEAVRTLLRKLFFDSTAPPDVTDIYKIDKKTEKVTFYPFLPSHKLDPWRQSHGVQEFSITYTDLGEFCFELDDAYVPGDEYDDEVLFDLPKLFHFLLEQFSKEDFYFNSISDYCGRPGELSESFKPFDCRVEFDEQADVYDEGFIDLEEVYGDPSFTYKLGNDDDDGSELRRTVEALRERGGIDTSQKRGSSPSSGDRSRKRGSSNELGIYNSQTFDKDNLHNMGKRMMKKKALQQGVKKVDDYDADARTGIRRREDYEQAAREVLEKKWIKAMPAACSSATEDRFSGRTEFSISNEIEAEEHCKCEDKSTCECSFIFEEKLDLRVRLNCRHKCRSSSCNICLGLGELVCILHNILGCNEKCCVDYQWNITWSQWYDSGRRPFNCAGDLKKPTFDDLCFRIYGIDTDDYDFDDVYDILATDLENRLTYCGICIPCPHGIVAAACSGCLYLSLKCIHNVDVASFDLCEACKSFDMKAILNSAESHDVDDSTVVSNVDDSTVVSNKGAPGKGSLVFRKRKLYEEALELNPSYAQKKLPKRNKSTLGLLNQVLKSIKSDKAAEEAADTLATGPENILDS